MNKFTNKEYKIFENIAQAKSILRKNNGNIEDENFIKLIKLTNKNNWLGLLTRFVYKDDIDIEEIESLYNDLKNSKLDLGKLNKMSYDDIIDLLYNNDNFTHDDNIVFAARYKNYLIFHVKEYKSGLKICSPSWCLKTKHFWDQYTAHGIQFVVIQEKYVNKSGKTKLLVPDSDNYFGEYRNTKNPKVRYGITYYPMSKTFDIFNDDNKVILKNNIDENILKEIQNYVRENNSSSDLKYDLDDVDMFFELISVLIPYRDSWSRVIHSNVDYESKFQDFLSLSKENNFDPYKFYEENSTYIHNNPDFTDQDGFIDWVLYRLSGNKTHDEGGIPLSGIFLKETPEISDNSYKYIYGFAQNKYGKMFILQSYNNIAEWYEYLLKNMGDIFFDNNMSINYIDTDDTLVLDMLKYTMNKLFLSNFEKNEKYCKIDFSSKDFIVHLNNLHNIIYNDIETILEDVSQIPNMLIKTSNIYTNSNILSTFTEFIDINLDSLKKYISKDESYLKNYDSEILFNDIIFEGFKDSDTTIVINKKDTIEIQFHY